MQKLLQRTVQAERQAARQVKKIRDRKAVEEKYKRRQSELRLLRTRSRHIREAREARREDWETGALAPRRDVGDKAETYATLEVWDMNLAEKRQEERTKWAPIMKGDRVVVLRGREKGRIGTVDRIDKRRNSITVNGVNVSDLAVPDWVPRDAADTRKVVPTTLPLPLEDVRLVYPLPDPATGEFKDTIIDRLVPKMQEEEPNSRRLDKGHRVIAGTNTIIPWPEEIEKEEEEHEDDTTAQSVEEHSFKPFLLHPPMPMSVIDELRGKYSKFRTRHDWDYLQKKREEDEKAERKKELPKMMRTPLQELAELRASKKAAEDKEFTPEQLAKIGEVIASEKAKVADSVRRRG